MLDRVFEFIRSAGASSEADTTRGGFLSYAAETHALTMGLGAGVLAGATGNERLLGLVLAAVGAAWKGKRDGKRAIVADVVREPQYAVGGLVVGLLMGLAVRNFV